MPKSLPRWLFAPLLVLSRCHACLRHTRGNALCADCQSTIPTAEQACRRCALPLTEAAELCGACQRQPPCFDQACAAALYDEPVNHWVTGLKFGHDLTRARLMAEAMRHPVTGLKRPCTDTALLAVPLHHQRLRQRGFNQAFEIARLLARLENMSLLTSGLRRHKATAQQTTLSKAQRIKNVRGAFSPTRRHWPAHVILVDDVMTTGNTLNECARVLKKAGVSRVDAVVFARA